MNPELINIIQNENGFVVVTHVNPDGDAIGSFLGMHLALLEMGKTSWAFIADEIPRTYSFLPSASIVRDPAVFSDSAKWIISLDVAEEKRISGDLSKIRSQTKLINIDHHPTNPLFGDFNLVEPTATSTAELVHQVLKAAGYNLSRDVGMCLYTGLVTDTGCFRFEGVSKRTLEIGAELLSPGIDSYEVTRHLYEEYPIHRLQLENLMLARLEVLLGGRLLISILYEEDFTKLGAALSDSENLANKLRQVNGVRVGILFTQMSNNLVRVSFRSKDVNVAAIAESFGGGGHLHAAGLKSTLRLEDLKAMIIHAVAKSLD